MLCCVLFRSMEVEGMTQISVMMVVVEGSPKIVRIGESLFYITNKNNGFWCHIFGDIVIQYFLACIQHSTSCHIKVAPKNETFLFGPFKFGRH